MESSKLDDCIKTATCLHGTQVDEISVQTLNQGGRSSIESKLPARHCRPGRLATWETSASGDPWDMGALIPAFRRNLDPCATMDLGVSNPRQIGTEGQWEPDDRFELVTSDQANRWTKMTMNHGLPASWVRWMLVLRDQRAQWADLPRRIGDWMTGE